jgi:N-methylhydantoinase A
VVDARMSDLLRTVTIGRGHDPRGFALYAFGGAGGSHAPAFGLELVGEILIPAFQSVQSALGAAASELAVELGRSRPTRLARDAYGADVDLTRIEATFAELEEAVKTKLISQGASAVVFDRFVEMRFARQAKEIRVPYPPGLPPTFGPILDQFLAAYGKRYGTESVPGAASFELVSCAVEGRAPGPPLPLKEHPAGEPDASDARIGERLVWDPGVGTAVDTAVYRGEELRCGNVILGPAIVQYADTTVALLTGQVCSVDRYLNLAIRDASGS